MLLAEAPPRPRRSRKPPTAGWWGDGPAPWEQWPGVTIQIDAIWIAKRERWETLDGRYWFDAEAADRACDFFPEFLKHYTAEFADLPFTLMPYQAQLVVRPLFGWKRTSDDLRRFRVVFLAVPKGNGKSPLAAGLGLFLTFCDEEEGAQVFSAAADRDQAAIVFDNARVMVQTSPDLDERAEVLRRSIYVPATRSSYRVLSSDVRTKHGPNVHALLIDEFHAQPNRTLYEVLKRGTIKRRQPVTVLITTAGDNDQSICAEEWEYARRVQTDPALDETFLPVVFEAAPDDDWRDSAVWRRVNPGFGLTVKADAIAREARAAEIEPRKLNDFLRYHLNRWVNQATAWIPIDWWDACPLELGPLDGLEMGAGLDLSQKYDLTALVLSFRIPVAAAMPEVVEVVQKDENTNEITKRAIKLNFEVGLVPFFWIPRETMLEREKQDRVPYSQWVAQGLVRVTDGDVVDYDRIFDDITGPIAKQYPRLKQAEIGYDPAFATQLALQLQAKGYRVVETPQNYKALSEPAQVFEALVRGRRIRHGGNRVLRNHVENVAIRQDDAGRIRPVKPRRGSTKRIDGVVASLMGVARLIANPVGAGGGWRPL